MGNYPKETVKFCIQNMGAETGDASVLLISVLAVTMIFPQ